MAFIVSRLDVSFVDFNNPYVGHLEELISRAEFAQTFGISLAGIETLAYEPDRNIYHIERKSGVEAFSSPEENELMLAIHNKFSEIKDFFEVMGLQKTKPSTYHELVAKAWVITPENQEKLDRELFETNFRAERDKLLVQADILIYKAEDAGQDTTALRDYRQALRDSTTTWVLPTLPVSA
jgi:hypothetical protein